MPNTPSLLDDLDAEAAGFAEAVDHEHYLNGSGQKAELDLQPIFDRHARLFSRETIGALDAADRTDERYPELRRLAVEGYLDAAANALTEEIADRETKDTVAWDGEHVPYPRPVAAVPSRPFATLCSRHALSRALLLPIAAALSIFATSCIGARSNGQPVPFESSTLTGAGFTVDDPTALALGPDGRLYISEYRGRIQAATMGPTDRVVAIEQIAPAGVFPTVLGLAFSPTDGKLYVSSSIVYPPPLPAPDYFPGKITRVDAPGVFTDIITGLPGSNGEHATNGIAFSPDGRLFIAQGGTTNAGVTSERFGYPSSPLSGAVLVADIYAPGFDGRIRYSDAVPSATTTQVAGDVSVYASGMRNPYDLVWHSNGKLYATDNGANAGSGPTSTDCETSGAEPQDVPDELNLIVEGDYYGHANRNRGRADPRQCTYWPGDAKASSNVHQPIALLKASSDGLAEYPIDASPYARRGDLFYVNWLLGAVRRLRLTADGQRVASDEPLAEGIIGALDIVATPGGDLYVAAAVADEIVVLKTRLAR